MKYHLITYGCQMNTADSEEMAQPLQAWGFTATNDITQADIILMNTCTVRNQAEHRAKSNLGRLREWKEENPNRILVVSGCAASRWGNSIKKRYPYIDAVSPATEIEQFPELIRRVLKERWDWDAETQEGFNSKAPSPLVGEGRGEGLTILTSSSAPSPTRGEGIEGALFGNNDTAYVTIMRGCNYTCSYCIVPQVRGREVYRPLPNILSEIETRVAEGAREVMLLGQTVNSYYYRDSGLGIRSSRTTNHEPRVPVYDFADLLRIVNAIPGVERIRFMSPHPRHMRDRVIQAMAECSKVCRHIHLPAQSGSNRILERMQRLYRREDYFRIVRTLRKGIPGLLITTDIIVGYPGETDADFGDTLSLLQEVQFDGLFAFKFSPRPGTPAAHIADDVPAALKESRLQEVLALNKSLVQSKGLWVN